MKRQFFVPRRLKGEPSAKAGDEDRFSLTVVNFSVLPKAARDILGRSLQDFGTEIVLEAGRLEAEEREEGLDSPEYTASMVVRARDKLRPVRVMRPPRRIWPDVLRVVAGGLVLLAGAAFGFAASASTIVQQRALGLAVDTWIVLGIAGGVIALLLTLTSLLAGRGAS